MPAGAGSLPARSRVSRARCGGLPDLVRGDGLDLGDLFLGREHRAPLEQPEGAVQQVLDDSARVAHLGAGEGLLVGEVRVPRPVPGERSQHLDRLARMRGWSSSEPSAQSTARPSSPDTGVEPMATS